MNKLPSRVLLILLIAVTLVLVTANNLFFKGQRVDLTEDRMFSIADGTVNILKSLETDVALKFFYSEEESTNLGFLRDYARRITDLLGEYELRSEGRMTLEVIDPEAFSEQEDEASELGIERISLGLGEEPLYFGLVAVGPDGDSEVIEFLHPDREEFLEYEVTKMIHKVSRESDIKIGMISSLQITGGFNEQLGRAMNPWQTYTQLRQIYYIENLEPDVSDIPDDLDLLVLVHPDNFSDSALYAIDQYALNGGNILAFVDELAQTDPLLAMAAGAGTVPERSDNFAPVLAAWGLERLPDAILADSEHALRVAGGSSQRPTPHLGVFGYGPDNFVSSDHPVLSQLNNVIFSSASAIQPLDNAQTNFEPLIQSSDQAGLLDASLLQNLQDPAQLADAFEATGERYIVAAHVTGAASSAYPDGRPVAEETQTAADADPDKETDAEKTEPREHTAESTTGGINVFVVADTDVLNDPLWVRVQDFLGQQMAQPFADNGNFFINSVENILGSTDLMSLRSRGTYIRPFHVVASMERDAAERFQDKERELQNRLSETEARLGQLRQPREGDEAFVLNEQQQQEVDNFRAEQLAIRKELREVRHQLGQDIDRLGGWIKLVNILLIPVILTLVALTFAFRRRAAVRRANLQQTHGSSQTV